MGQATVDLPDPLESPSAGKAAGADDLLAQMAGEEIDRLLAEAEADSIPVEEPRAAEVSEPLASSAPATSTGSSESTLAATETLADELDSLLTTLVTAREPGSAPAAPAPPAAVERRDVPTSESESGVSSTESAGLLSGTVQETQAAAGRTVVETAPLSEAPPPVLEETSAAERQALAAAPGADSVTAQQIDKAVAAAADAVVAESEPQASADASLPLLLRPLEWLNAPFDACPDFLRELVGKAAILTVVNAGAVIFYVHFIRRH
jgi:hypothetical protein